MSKVIDIPGQQFDQEVRKTKKPVFVNFYVSWEPRCPFKEKTLRRLAQAFSGRIKFVSVDLAGAPDLETRYRDGRSAPMRLFQYGKVLATFRLFRPFDEFRAVLEFILADGIIQQTQAEPSPKN